MCSPICGGAATLINPIAPLAIGGVEAEEQEDALHEAEIGERRVGKECRSRWSPYH